MGEYADLIINGVVCEECNGEMDDVTRKLYLAGIPADTINALAILCKKAPELTDAMIKALSVKSEEEVEMCNFWLNVRFGMYHLQGVRGWKFWMLKISKNEMHRHNLKRFEVYTFRKFWRGGRR